MSAWNRDRRKGFVDFAVLLLLVSVSMYIILLLDSYNTISNAVKIKGSVGVHVKADDRGSEIASLMNSKSGGVKRVEGIGTAAAMSKSESMKAYLKGLKDMMDKVYAGYYLSVRGPYGEMKISKNPPEEYKGRYGAECGVEERDENVKLSLPVKGIRVSSGFGYREKDGVCDCHGGIDFAAPKDTPVYAAADGTVWRIAYNHKGYGKYVVLKHDFGGSVYYTIYGDLNEAKVAKGQKVKEGELIGLSGNSGSGEYHLHFEVRRDVDGGFGLADRDSVDPCPFMELDGCRHEPVEVCRTVEGKGVDVLSAEIPLPGAVEGKERANMELRKWD